MRSLWSRCQYSLRLSILATGFASATGCASPSEKASMPAAATAPAIRTDRDESRFQAQARVIHDLDELCERETANAAVAAKKSESADLRAFAAELGREYRDLRRVLAKNGGRDAAPAPASERRPSRAVEWLDETNGAAFDRGFLQITVLDHERTLAELDKDLLFADLAPGFRSMLETDARATIQQNLEKARSLLAATE